MTNVNLWKQQGRPQLVESYQITYLNALMTMFCLIQELDALRATDAYKQKIKNLSIALVKELEKEVDKDLGLLWGTDDPAMYNLLENKKLMLRKMATMRTEYVAGLGQLFEQWERHPELVLHRNGIPIVHRSMESLVEETAKQQSSQKA